MFEIFLLNSSSSMFIVLESKVYDAECAGAFLETFCHKPAGGLAGYTHIGYVVDSKGDIVLACIVRPC